MSIQFDAIDPWAWQLVGDARLLARDEADRQVIDALRLLGEADVTAVAEAIGKRRTAANERLIRLAGAGKVIARQEATGRRPRILYRLPLTNGQVVETDPAPAAAIEGLPS